MDGHDHGQSNGAVADRPHPNVHWDLTPAASTGDPEVDAMGTIAAVLNGLEGDSRQRVVGWVASRWGGAAATRGRKG